MSNRNLELTLRARADTRELERLSTEMDSLVQSMRRLASSVDGARDDARALADAYARLGAEEAKSVEQATRLAQAVSETAAARARAAAAASSAGDAEARTVVAQQQQQQAAQLAADANDRLAQSKLGSISASGQAATAEERLAAERQKTLDSTDRAAKEEQDVADARDKSRQATEKAVDAENQLSSKRSAAGNIGGLIQKSLVAAGGIFAVQQLGDALIDFGKDSIMAASDVEESAAKFKVVFRDLAGTVEKDLKAMAEANRRSAFDLMAYAATLQDTFVPLGFARDTAADMSKTVVQLGLDLAAFNNSSDSEAIQRLTSALVGNAEAVRAYGIVLTESTVKAELAAMGADKYTGAALENAKAQARLNVILRSTTDAQGAAIREAEGFSSTLKAWSAAVLDLKVSLGEGLLPLMTDLASAAIAVVDAFNGRDAAAALGLFDQRLASATSVDDYGSALNALRERIIATANPLERVRVLFGNIGATDNIRPILQDMARASGSAEEFAAAIERADLAAVGSFYFGRGSNGLALTAEQFYEATIQAGQLEVAGKRTADELARMSQYSPVDISIVADVDTEAITTARDAIGQFGDSAEQVLGSYFTALNNVKAGVIENWEAVKLLKETWLDAFSSAPVDDVLAAQKELADLQSRQAAGETIPQADIDAARQAIVEANQAIGESYKQRALDALTAKAIEEGNFQAVASIAQAAVAMGLMTQAEADMRASFANTVIEVDKLSASLDGLSASAQGSAIAGLAAGVYDTAEAARQAAENLDAVRNFWANGPQGDIGSFYEGLSDPDRLAEIETELRVRVAEESRAVYETWRAGLDEYAATEYKSVIATEFGTSITDFRDLKDTAEEYGQATYTSNVNAATEPAMTALQRVYQQVDDLTKNEWTIRVRTIQYGDISTAAAGTSGGGGGGGDPEEDGRGRTFVVEGVTVNNYSGGPGVAEQTRRGVLAAFRSLA